MHAVVVFVLILTHFLSVCGYSFVYDDVQPVLHVHHLSAVITWISAHLYLEPKPVYAQPGQPDVDLPVSPSDAPVPTTAHDDSILR